MKQKYKTRKYSGKQLLFAVLDTVICAAVAVFAAMIKFYLTGDAIAVNFALCVIYALLLAAAFYGGLLMFVPELISSLIGLAIVILLIVINMRKWKTAKTTA